MPKFINPRSPNFAPMQFNFKTGFILGFAVATTVSVIVFGAKQPTIKDIKNSDYKASL